MTHRDSPHVAERNLDKPHEVLKGTYEILYLEWKNARQPYILGTSQQEKNLFCTF